MSSSIYMKVLESQPERYDRGITLLSLGAADRARRRLVDDLVEPGMRVLEIGCGTGALTVLAARRGAEVVAFDVSDPMLAMARRKVVDAGVSDRVHLEHEGVSGMDAFEDESFDLVAATLVFSELSSDERVWALRHSCRVLRPAGRLGLVDEVTPESLGEKLVHGAVRLPLLLVTFALTQTTTQPVDGLSRLVAEAGFRVETEERTALGSLLYLVAAKETTE
ncbi:MAG: methyltransferase domain-containing protein [Acidobacteria bacterium]|jgi:demethylmenaquinone methyltransferase/2-methoxy-6-polyprenyl-1,4-benzoquinol methylase|nr:methyltransferase domain-containing protein [Acidobacteriota bacterium]